MGLEYLVYTPLMEEKTYRGWDKTTIDYIIENEKMIKNSIRNSLRKRAYSTINSADIDDIYSEILLYFYEVDDYNVSKAVRTIGDGKEYIISLEDYVFKSISFCLKRFLTKKYNKDSLMVNTEVKTPEDNLLDLLDTVADNKSDIDFQDVTVDLNQHCKNCESIRYKYGIDIYQMWFVGLTIINEELDSHYYDTIMNILGISKKDLKEISIDSYEDDEILEFSKGISKHGVQESINIIRPYVYSVKHIEDAIKNFKVAEVV